VALSEAAAIRVDSSRVDGIGAPAGRPVTALPVSTLRLTAVPLSTLRLSALSSSTVLPR